jgi:hypothetical protein
MKAIERRAFVRGSLSKARTWASLRCSAHRPTPNPRRRRRRRRDGSSGCRGCCRSSRRLRRRLLRRRRRRLRRRLCLRRRLRRHLCLRRLCLLRLFPRLHRRGSQSRRSYNSPDDAAHRCSRRRASRSEGHPNFPDRAASASWPHRRTHDVAVQVEFEM